jgi:hypothetical protein
VCVARWPEGDAGRCRRRTGRERGLRTSFSERRRREEPVRTEEATTTRRGQPSSRGLLLSGASSALLSSRLLGASSSVGLLVRWRRCSSAQQPAARRGRQSRGRREAAAMAHRADTDEQRGWSTAAALDLELRVELRREAESHAAMQSMVLCRPVSFIT